MKIKDSEKDIKVEQQLSQLSDELDTPEGRIRLGEEAYREAMDAEKGHQERVKDKDQ